MKGDTRMDLDTRTARALEMPPGRTDHWVWDERLPGYGLRLRRLSNGDVRRTRYFQYDLAGKTYKLPLGDAMVLPDEKTRRAAAEAKAKVLAGRNPKDDVNGALATAAETMGAVLPTYLRVKKGKVSPRHYGEIERHLLKYWKLFHAQPLRRITPLAVTDQYEKLAEENGPAAANNAWKALHAFCRWAYGQNLLDRNPTLGTMRHDDVERDRVLKDPEIFAVWRAADRDHDYDAIIQLLILTGCRRDEIGGLRWSEIQSDRIVLPSERTKNGEEHTIFLTPLMRAVLDKRVRQLGEDQVFGPAEGCGYVAWGTSKATLDTKLKLKPWVHHDLRRSCSTGMGELKINPWVADDIVLNHKSGWRGGLSGRYNKAQLEDEARNAWMTWDAHIAALLAGDRPPGVRQAA